MKTKSPAVVAVTIQFVRLIILVSLLCVLCRNSPAQDFKTLHPGIEYAHVDHKIGNDPVKINLLRLDLKKVRLDVHHALDAAIGVEPTSSIARRNDAIAAINGGFFRLDTSIWNGDAASLLKIDGRILSEPSKDRVAMLIKNQRTITEVFFGHPKLIIRAKTKSGKLEVLGINRERKSDGDLVLYTSEFGRSTLTAGIGVEVIIANDRVRSVELSHGSSFIPPNGYVLSACGKYADELRRLVRGKNSKLEIQFGDFASDDLVFMGQTNAGNGVSGLGSAEDATNGVPQLIQNGQVKITWEQEKASKSFAETRHPRTAVAKLKDGKFLMITVDGRQPGVSVGMTLQELADYILSLGASDAMNLDGGGSTTMYVDGKVVNTPSEKDGERRVSDAIIVTLRKN